MKDFFISYNRHDKAWAEWIAWVLEENGYTVTIQAWDFRPGGNFAVDMDRAIKHSERTIAVLSETYLESAYAEAEWIRAFINDPNGQKHKLLPVKVKPCEPEGLLQGIVYESLLDKSEAEAEDALLKAVQKGRAKPEVKPSYPGKTRADKRVTQEKRAFPGNQEAAASKPVVGLEQLQEVGVWVGRDELVQRLQREFLAPNHDPKNANSPKVLALIGQGGIGKSSLAVKLLEAVGVTMQSATLAASSPYDGVMCFKAQEGSSFDEIAVFLLRALGLEPPESIQQPKQIIGHIIQGLQQGRYLLVLDNLESVLHPARAAEAGKTLEPEWGALLHALAYKPHRSQLVLTSRQTPKDLAADPRYDAEPDPTFVKLENLGGINEAAGVTLLKQRRMKDSDADLRWIARKVDGHVFVLTQLATIARNKPGYLRKHPKLVTQKAEPILQEQLARQSDAAKELLKRMCVLRVGITVEGLTFLRLYQDEDNAAEVSASSEEIQATQTLVDRLVESSLIQRRYDECQLEDLYDLHRLIVEFLQGSFQAELPELMQRVYRFYNTQQRINNPKTLDDLRPLLEAQHFAFQIGQYGEARRLLRTLYDYLHPWGFWKLITDLSQQLLPHLQGDDVCMCLQLLGAICRNCGAWNEAEKYVQQALDNAESKAYQASCLGLLGHIARYRGQWDNAERLFQQSLALWEELGNRAGMAASWSLLGTIARYRSQWDNAERLYRRCLAVEEELGDRAGMAASWELLGDIARKRGQWDNAERLFQQSLALREELGDRAGMAASWGQLGIIARKRGQWDNAERLFQQSLALQEELGDRAGMAASWGQLGTIARYRGQWDNVERLFRQSLALREELGDRAGMAASWGQLGDIARKRGQWDNAERLFQQSLALQEELGDRTGMAESRGLLGDIARYRGQWDNAERLFQQSLALREELGDRTGMAESRGLLGDIARKRGQWDNAERLFQQSLALQEELGDRTGMATSWGCLGDIARKRGQWDDAERLFRQSLALLEELGDRAGMATSWGCLGDIAQNRGQWDEAEHLYRQCLAVKEELGDRAGMATSWGALGDIARYRGQWDDAERLFQQSLDLREELSDRAGMATSWGCLGDIAQNRGQWDEAEHLYRQSLAVREDLGDRAGIAETNYDLAQLERQRGNTTLAETFYTTAHQLYQTLGAAKDLERIEQEWGSDQT